MTFKKRSLTTLVLLSALLSACGQKGSLYIPSEPRPQPASAAPAAEPKTISAEPPPEPKKNN